ncbi:MAG: PadR family transcriptional regulator [Desulfurococcales archaeon]|nr:PadR family transcriptional regulator [Desulfurococcales archaeon]
MAKPVARERGSSVYRESLRNLVLRILLEGPRHGYEIMKKIEEVTNGKWKPAAGTLYPLLDQLRSEGLIEVDGIEVSRVRGGKRIRYRLTSKGMREAARMLMEKAETKFDIIRFYLVEGALWLRRAGLEEEYKAICEGIRRGFEKLGVFLEESCS